ncbi:unnamed protein product [Brassicogethes aeneus]|uniref:Regulatory protein zeste n=1 Tax=Brassicogethes aeneus TaxID=1431903 RepID=A0A9P0ARR8_BRAAE|nr:unnamed protein product [Brassicogethes aeneus]
MQFLHDVLSSKKVLFGSFSDKLTKEDKVKAWKTIHEKALALGLVSANKDLSYTKDRKIDNRKKTGSEGGPDCKLNETDNLIIDFLGRDTVLVKGLSSKETWEKTTPSVDEMGHENKENEMPSTPALVNTVKAKKSCTSVPAHNESELRVKKLSLEIMEKEYYLKSLEIFKQEKELGLPPSHFTAIFHAAQQEILVQADTEVEGFDIGI